MPKLESLSLIQDIRELLLLKILKGPRKRNDNSWKIVKELRIHGDGQGKNGTHEKRNDLGPHLLTESIMSLSITNISENATCLLRPFFPWYSHQH